MKSLSFWEQSIVVSLASFALIRIRGKLTVTHSPPTFIICRSSVLVEFFFLSLYLVRFEAGSFCVPNDPSSSQLVRR